MSKVLTASSVRTRILAVAVVALMSLSGAVAVSETASASGYLCVETACPNGSQWALARGTSGDWHSYWGQAAGHNCTNYVAWRLINNGVSRFHMTGDASSWASSAVAAGIPVDHTPTVGSIAEWDANAGGMTAAGHVAYVEAVNGSTVTVSEDAYNGGSQTGPFRWRDMAASTPSWYIHFGGTQVVAPVTTGERIGALQSDGSLLVKEGGVGNMWTEVASNVASFSISGNRIGIVDTSGVASVKEGSLGAGWTVVATGASSIVLGGTRIAVIQSGTLQVKDGAVGNLFVPVANSVAQVSMTSNRLAVRLSDGTIEAKDGAVTGTWIIEATGSDVAVTDTRLAIIDPSGNALVKEGALTQTWTTLSSNVSNLELSANRIGVVNSGTLSVKDGVIGAAWSTLTSSVTQFTLSANLVGVMQGDAASVKEGAITNPWTIVATGVTNVAVSG